MNNFKRTFVKFYLLAGIVWLIVTMPNLLLSAKGNPIIAFGIAIVRVILWPVHVGRLIYATIKNKRLTQQEDEDSDA